MLLYLVELIIVIVYCMACLTATRRGCIPVSTVLRKSVKFFRMSREPRKWTSESPKYYLGKHTPDPSRSFRLRHLFNYPALKSRKTLGDRSFFVAAPKLWNELPSDIRDLNSINRFKTAIKTYLFRQAFLQCLI